MKGKVIINPQQIVKIYVSSFVPVNDFANDFLKSIGYWEYKEYKTVKRLFRKPIEVYEPGWYRTSMPIYDIKHKYFKTDEELMSFLKDTYWSKYVIRDKVLYLCPKVSIDFSDQSNKTIYFNDETEVDNFLNDLYSKNPTLQDIIRYIDN